MKLTLCAFLLMTLAGGPALANGAIAVGVPSNVAKNGFAAGMSGDFATSAAAQQDALATCKKGSAAPASTRALCRVAQTFISKCGAIAADPAPNTPGFGWAVAFGSVSAAQWALSKCRATAGPGRARACRIMTVTCDGSAK